MWIISMQAGGLWPWAYLGWRPWAESSLALPQLLLKTFLSVDMSMKLRNGLIFLSVHSHTSDEEMTVLLASNDPQLQPFWAVDSSNIVEPNDELSVIFYLLSDDF